MKSKGAIDVPENKHRTIQCTNLYERGIQLYCLHKYKLKESDKNVRPTSFRPTKKAVQLTPNSLKNQLGFWDYCLRILPLITPDEVFT